jgi:hypothetical protein
MAPAIEFGYFGPMIWSCSLVIAREICDQCAESLASWNLGLTLEKEGDLARAVELLQVSVDFQREIGHPDAEKDTTWLEQLRQRLAGEGSGTVAGAGE